MFLIHSETNEIVFLYKKEIMDRVILHLCGDTVRYYKLNSIIYKILSKNTVILCLENNYYFIFQAKSKVLYPLSNYYYINTFILFTSDIEPINYEGIEGSFNMDTYIKKINIIPDFPVNEVEYIKKIYMDSNKRVFIYTLNKIYLLEQDRWKVFYEYEYYIESYKNLVQFNNSNCICLDINNSEEIIDYYSEDEEENNKVCIEQDFNYYNKFGICVKIYNNIIGIIKNAIITNEYKYILTENIKGICIYYKHVKYNKNIIGIKSKEERIYDYYYIPVYLKHKYKGLKLNYIYYNIYSCEKNNQIKYYKFNCGSFMEFIKIETYGYLMPDYNKKSKYIKSANF